ncbi:hypothetical protein BC937DRAFT_87387 [Endogone sp. FLAS-F59071]|nr:hypothetical protein BC937DRAFT_87387 [Endogone sp. FLAS-F59071]|eukprot:RUS19494.1 hypothetical protein BC937DRAFT_87387 [Endogone sp. FLAS-F59071]
MKILTAVTLLIIAAGARSSAATAAKIKRAPGGVSVRNLFTTRSECLLKYNDSSMHKSETPRTVYLPPFKKAILEGGARHDRLFTLTIRYLLSSYDGIPAAATDHHQLTDVLKNDWGFKGRLIPYLHSL